MNVSGLGALVAVVLAATACAGSGPDGSRRDGQARETQQQFRAAAHDALPGLAEATGGSLTSMTGRFVECEVSGLWHYTAYGELHEPSGTARQIAGRAQKSLDAAGFDATVEDDLDVEADRGRVRLVVSPALNSEVRSVSLLRLSMSDDCADYSDRDEAFARRAGVTDLTASAG